MMLEKIFPNDLPDKIYFYLWYQQQKPLLREYHQLVKIYYESYWSDSDSDSDSDSSDEDRSDDEECFYRLGEFIFNYRNLRELYGGYKTTNTLIFNIKTPIQKLPRIGVPYNYDYTSKCDNRNGFTDYRCNCNKFPCNCTDLHQWIYRL